MRGSVNLCIIQGNLGRDPDIRTIQTGAKIANMSIATAEQWKDRASGERRKKVEWIRVVVFNEALVGVIERYVKKGSTIYVEGALRTREWTDRGGEKRLSTEVVLTQFRGVLKLMGSPASSSRQDSAPRGPSATDQRGNPQYDDSEIPF